MGLASLLASLPTACAVDCILAPLCGYKVMSGVFGVRFLSPLWGSLRYSQVLASLPTACAVGCILAPLCGYKVMSGVFGVRFFRPYGARFVTCKSTHGLRRGLHSCAALRLQGDESTHGLRRGLHSDAALRLS